MSRFVDRGAKTAGWVGLGMAATIWVSFLLVIPIEAVYWYSTLPAGLLIGYYANARSERAGGPWLRLASNAVYAGLVTGVTFAVLFLLTKALFFNLDEGYRDASMGGPLACQKGADCAYQRYAASEQGPAMAAAGITDTATFSAFYWNQQLTVSGMQLGFSVGGALFAGLMFGAVNRRRPEGSVPAA